LLVSHLACADEPQHPLNQIQYKKFLENTQRIKSFFPDIRFSLANSSGIFLGKDWHFDLVRPGAALYGINPIPNLPNPMEAVVKLALPIMQIRTLDEDNLIGYGGSGFLKKGSRIAVVAGGYADGLHRTLGLSPEGILNGTRVAAVGRISMDTTIFDISSVNIATEHLNSHIHVISEEISLEYISKKNKLLGYEILTSLGSRYKRNYLSEPSV
jgi:alanine racemase